MSDAPDPTPEQEEDLLALFTGDVKIEAYGTVENPPEPEES